MEGVVLTLQESDLTKLLARFAETYGPDLFPLVGRLPEKHLTLPLTSAAVRHAFREKEPLKWEDMQRKSTEKRAVDGVAAFLKVTDVHASVEGGNQGFVVLVDDENGVQMAMKLSLLRPPFTPALDLNTDRFTGFVQLEARLGHGVPLVLAEPVADAAIAFLLGSWKASGWLWGVPYYYGSALTQMHGNEFKNVEGGENGHGVYQALLMQRGECTLHDFARENGARPTQAETYAKEHMADVPLKPPADAGGKEDDAAARRAHSLLQALCAQLLSQIALLETLCDFVHGDYHEKNAMVVSLGADPLALARVGPKPEEALEVIVRRDHTNVSYKIPTYGKLIMLIDFGRASLVVPQSSHRGAERPTRILGHDFVPGILASESACPDSAACAGGTDNDPTFRDMLHCKNALSNNDDVIRLIMTLYWTAGEKALLGQIFDHFRTKCPELESLARRCEQDYQRVGIFASRTAVGFGPRRKCSLSAVDLFEFYATHAGFRQAACQMPRPRKDPAYVIDLRSVKVLSQARPQPPSDLIQGIKTMVTRSVPPERACAEHERRGRRCDPRFCELVARRCVPRGHEVELTDAQRR
jgi:hypothetical protein